MKNLILLPLVALMFLATSCNDDVTPQKAQSSRAKLHEMSSNALINFGVDIDEALDEYILSTDEARTKLAVDLLELGVTQLNIENATSYTINSEDYVPYVTAIISHVDWAGSVYEDLVTSFVAAGVVSVPSVFYYVFDFPNDSGFAVLSADSRRPISLVHYQEEGEISNLDFDMESCIDMLFDFDGRMHGIDSITLADLHSRVGLSMAFPMDLQVLSCITEMAHYRGSTGGNSISYKSDPINILTTRIDHEWEWKNDYPYVTSGAQATHTNIPLAIVKILAHEGYVGELCGELFNGIILRQTNNPSSIAYWTDLIYEAITSDPTTSVSEQGLNLLNPLNFTFTTPEMLTPITQGVDTWLPASYLISPFCDALHPGIVFVDNEHWELLVGAQVSYSVTYGFTDAIIYIEHFKRNRTDNYIQYFAKDISNLVSFYNVTLQ